MHSQTIPLRKIRNHLRIFFIQLIPLLESNYPILPFVRHAKSSGSGSPCGQERLNSNSRVAFDHKIVIIIIKIVFGWEILDFRGNFGFSGKFRILGEISDFGGNFGFSGKFQIFGEISDFRGNFRFSGKFQILGEISDFQGNFRF